MEDTTMLLAFGYMDVEDCPWFLTPDEDDEDVVVVEAPDPGITEDDLF
jgi:hypothetical protein